MAMREGIRIVFLVNFSHHGESQNLFRALNIELADENQTDKPFAIARASIYSARIGSASILVIQKNMIRRFPLDAQYSTRKKQPCR